MESLTNEETMTIHDPELRKETVGTRLTAAERRMLQEAANARGTTLCKYIAEVAVEATRSELEAA
jgi:uncharacterized protein (DUF1778 family)